MNVHSSGHVLSAPPSLTPRQELNKEIIDAAVRMSNRNSSFTDNANSSSLLGSGGTPNSSLGTIIQAKPQLKNLIGDATRFVPTSLKVRRTTRDGRGRIISVGGGIPSSGPGLIGSSSDGHSRSIDGKAINANAQASKDDAYEEFMREMETLL
ncbi:unnamed protein product [Protopolystoma xenopodis]|uniref:Uncharacterized protein n=1 Tax=Protopolystoma xenopodis TaxID=117903 RepID=A0A3S5ARE0_9PLAT|nr:unnamed protein product [Protopolystoma xenopodis]